MKNNLLKTSLDKLITLDEFKIKNFSGNVNLLDKKSYFVIQNIDGVFSHKSIPFDNIKVAREFAKHCVLDEDDKDFEVLLASNIGIDNLNNEVYRISKSYKIDKTGKTDNGTKAKIQFLKAEPDLSLVRDDKFEGNDFTVVPVIALVEGVIQCMTCPTPELALAKEFANPVEAWNGRPVTMGHPMVDGLPVSASDPKLLENEAIGIIFNAELLEEPNRLYAELWLNKNKISSVGERAQDYLDRILAGEKVEVSTGYFADLVENKGEFNGKSYLAIQNNIKPDHIAILGVNEKPACSWEMGCGTPRSNSCGSTCDCNSCITMTKQNDKKMNKEAAKRHRNFINVNLLTNNKLTFDDTRTAVISALRKIEPNLLWINALFDDMVVYETWTDMDIKQRSYSIADNGLGEVTIGDEITIVRPVTKFVPAKDGDKMDKKALIDAVINNNGNNFIEDDRKFLETLEETQLAKFIVETKETTGNEPEEKPAPTEVKPTGIAEFLNSAPEEVKAILTEALSHRKTTKKALVNKILEIKDCAFTAEELNSFDINTLQKVLSLTSAKTKLNDYAGLGALFDDSDDQDKDEAVPATKNVFDLKAGNIRKNFNGVSKLDKAVS